ncbi:type IX secretion system sortase PorU [Roseivirga sp.]|uniref:type IX secretion system sortase PorU n=1 Tax=Roseivirga sp. TaxID=1964215 RepID=UPI002B275B2F|nr:type IX secretion system sortase PorU [Roseivirga sp.]
MASRLRSKHILLIAFFIQVFVGNATAQNSSVLATGKWVKMSFDKEGVYRIDQSTLSQMGFDIGSINPQNIAIYGSNGGMLPQAISIQREGLKETSIFVAGESDATFNAGDYILFYVDRVNELRFNPTTKNFESIQNLYADEVHYFITVKNSKGLRIESLPNLGTNLPEVSSYNKIIRHETDTKNILGSGRKWYGESFSTNNELRFDFPLSNLAANEQIKVQLDALSQAFNITSMSASLNSQSIGQLDFSPIQDTRYGIKGNEASDVFEISSSNFSGSGQLSLKLSFNPSGSNRAVAYLDNFLMDIPTKLQYTGSLILFRSAKSLAQALTTFKISEANQNLMVWDITNPLVVQSQTINLSGSEIRFGAFSDQLHEYAMFEAALQPLPTKFAPLANQDLKGSATPDMVIISAPEFLTEAERLASFRRSADNLSVLVATPQQVYNEFSAGRQDITAIRDFMRHLKIQNDQLKYLLLFGKGSYDYKSRIESNSNFVPTYESRSSIHPLTSYSSDDYFGFLEEDEGEWVESRAGDHTSDIGMGRIPSTTLAQAKTAVDKIINYQTSTASIGDWRRRLVFVADDGDNNLHQRDADQLATLVDTTYAGFNVRKIYLDAYEQIRSPNGESSPKAEKALLDAVEQGVLIMNFTGHGAETGWMQERILTTESIDDWKNTNRLPLLVTATCEFARNDDPSIFSGGEKIIFKEDGGAIALVATARPVFSSSNYALNLALYKTILEQPNGNFQRLGDIIRFTKNNALNGANNRNFILLGDPSMRLAYPKNEITITSINGKSPAAKADTISALERVRIEGQIESNGKQIETFNGELTFSLFDKRNTLQTIGTESDKFKYLERNGQLFNGQASVINGAFTVEFVVPKNINYQYGSGKMSMYALNKSSPEDAFGAKIDFILGGTAQNLYEDNIPPSIRTFINDSTPVIRPVLKRDATLILKLFDESGINISENGIGQNLSVTLNDSVTYNLNSFYDADKDNFRKGEALFPMRDLPLGINTLEIKAWDNYNNLTKKMFEFTVTNENSTIITEINSYPNPLIENTTFNISHNSAGEPLDLWIEIINAQGEKVISIHSDIEVGSNTESIEWNGLDNFGVKLGKGIYVYNVVLMSKNNGKTYTKRKKLIISY